LSQVPASQLHATERRRALRDALGCFATGVTVVTTVEKGGDPVGLTINSFSAVSLEPALVLFCLGERANSLPVFLAAEFFAVNILSLEQERLSSRFARAGGDKWSDLSFSRGLGGCPLLPGCVATFECRRKFSYPGGDHVILVGEVERYEWHATREPLLFLRGAYGGFRADL